MSPTPADMIDDRRRKLKSIFPEAFPEGHLDLELLCQALGGRPPATRERYGLNWVGKAEAIRSLQIASDATLSPARHESVEFDASDNVIIEGDNLEALNCSSGAMPARCG